MSAATLDAAAALGAVQHEAMNDEAPGAGEYTIDELAAASRVSSRTIRFYQSRGALQPPEIRGRVAYYGAAHKERLELISQLQDRGLRIDAIRDLMQRIDKGELDLAQWLGVEEQVQAPWVNDQARTVSEKELLELAGSTRPGWIADLVRTRLVDRHGDVYLVRSPALLVVAMRLEAGGVDLQTAMEASKILRKHFARAVAELVTLFVDGAKEANMEAKELVGLFQTLRPAGNEAVRVIFGREMEERLRGLVESGALAKIAGKERGKKRR